MKKIKIKYSDELSNATNKYHATGIETTSLSVLTLLLD